jgi:hypothetical protein
MPRTPVQVYRPLRPRHHWGIFMCLVDHPQTLDEIQAAFQENESNIARCFGLFEDSETSRHYAGAAATLPEDLAALTRTGWVAREGERYALTPAWRELALVTSAQARPCFA